MALYRKIITTADRTPVGERQAGVYSDSAHKAEGLTSIPYYSSYLVRGYNCS